MIHYHTVSLTSLSLGAIWVVTECQWLSLYSAIIEWNEQLLITVNSLRSPLVSGQYETATLDSTLPSSYSWTSSTLPSSSSTVVGGSSSAAYGYHSNTNNMSPGSSLLNSTSPSSLSGETTNPDKVFSFRCLFSLQLHHIIRPIFITATPWPEHKARDMDNFMGV